MSLLTWIRRYKIRTFFQESTWVFPVSGIIVGLIQLRITNWIDSQTGWSAEYAAGATQGLLNSLAASLLTFIVFVCSSLLVAVQLASAQLTPRVIALVYRDLGTRLAVAYFGFAFTSALGAAVRTGDKVPLLTAYIAAYSCLFSVGVFFYLIDRLMRFLRPIGALRQVSRLGHKVIEQVYPRLIRDAPVRDELPPGSLTPELEGQLDANAATVITGRTEGTLQAFDVPGLLALARRHECIIELVPQAGDFVSRDEPLFRIYGARAQLNPAELLNSVAIGMERTWEQDPSYAFRVAVDIASKALSPAINDPTTAVLAIDQVHRMLRKVGMRRLDEGIVRDSAGAARFIYWTRDWQDFVRLSVTEIRHFGCESMQVVRRLRAMLDDLIAALPEERAALLRHEAERLQRTAERLFEDPEDRAMAAQGDLQGVGGRRSVRNGSARKP